MNNITENSSIKLDTVTKVQPTQKVEKPIEKIQEESKKVFTDVEKDTMKQIVKLMNKLPSANDLEFSFNEEARMSVVEIHERDSKRLIRQFPTEEFFSRLSYFKDNILPGLLMDQKV